MSWATIGVQSYTHRSTLVAHVGCAYCRLRSLIGWPAIKAIHGTEALARGHRRPRGRDSQEGCERGLCRSREAGESRWSSRLSAHHGPCEEQAWIGAPEEARAGAAEWSWPWSASRLWPRPWSSCW